MQADKKKQHLSILKAITDMVIGKKIFMRIVNGSPAPQVNMIPTELLQITCCGVLSCFTT
jgi:hypothetical protein